ncbi:chemotaxis protein [Campylobacter concisus]|uniref:chemotaxis protein n=1 Tax=Campylobacter concisus TaxID=199 RepID=UPI000B3D5C32|nr:chemotaxis protein [Campylobacter concisus]OUT08586.1 chemotaxis protein [Campylobacter concisus]
MLKAEVIYKFCIVCALACGICLLAFTGLNFAMGDYSEWMMNAHKFAGILIFCAAILHVFNRRRKLIKLINEMIDVTTHRKNPTICNMDRIIASLEPYSITEISQMLGFDEAIFCETLHKNGVKFNDASQTLRQIARMNDEKIFFVLVLIVEAKFGKRFCGVVSCNVGRKF